MAIPAQSPEPELGTQASAAPWPPVLRLAFRFAFSYLLLYCAPETGRVSIISPIPGLSYVADVYTRLWHLVVPWVAVHLFHLSGRRTTYFPTGSGDTTLAYIQNLVYLVIALLAALLWSTLDRKRRDYRTLHEWLRILVRYTLALTLFEYGFAKIFPLQFRPPMFWQLLQPHGEFSPMGVLWTFMGASLPYTIFVGASEALGGFLLLFRRTTSLGAMVSVAVLANVVALNFCYDVPVKLYSLNLLLMAVFLLAPDLGRLLNGLVRNRPAAAAALGSVPFRRLRLQQAAIVVKVLFVGYVLYSQIYGGWSAYREAYSTTSRPPLYGAYEVERFLKDGQEVPPLLTEGTRWRYTTFDDRMTAVRQMNDNRMFLQSVFEAGNRLRLGPGKESFTYSRPDSDHVSLQGTLAGSRLDITMRKIDPAKFLLLNRGFHWINEQPFNR